MYAEKNLFHFNLENWWENIICGDLYSEVTASSIGRDCTAVVFKEVFESFWEELFVRTPLLGGMTFRKYVINIY